MRFDSAREAGLDETKADLVRDGYANRATLTTAEKAALALTDLMIHVPQPPDAALAAELKAHFTPAQLAELALGISLFLGMSKVLITLGLEPEDMPVTVIPTPGSQVAAG